MRRARAWNVWTARRGAIVAKGDTARARDGPDLADGAGWVMTRTHVVRTAPV